MAKTMGVAATAMGKMNAQISLPEMQKTMQKFEQENTKMAMSEEMSLSHMRRQGRGCSFDD